MNERLNDFEDLEDYVLERMSEPDRAAFESAMKADDALRRRVEALRKEKEVLYYLRRAVLKEKMAAWRAEQPRAETPPATPSRDRRRTMWLLAMALGAVLIFIWLWYLRFQRPAVQESSLPAPEFPAVVPDTPAQVPPANAESNKLPPPSAPQAGVWPENWQKWGDQAYTTLLEKDVLMGAPSERDIADSIMTLAAQNRLDDAFRLAYSLDTTQSAAQLHLAHITFLKRDYATAAHWYGRLKDNPGNARFRLDAQLNEIACYVYLLPKSTPVLLDLMRPVMERPDAFGLSGSRLAAFEQVWKRINKIE